MSGHCFKLAPSLGLGTAELVVDGQVRSFDWSVFAYGRFARPRQGYCRPRARMIGGVLLAAGAGTRFRAAGGGVKLLAPVGGRPLVEWALAALAEAPLGDRVIVLGAHADELLAATDLQGARPVRNERWERGMASSLQVGLAALDPACTAAVVVLGDGPELAAEAIRRVAVAGRAGAEPLSGCAYGSERSGHPVAIPRALCRRGSADGERGGRACARGAVRAGRLQRPASAGRRRYAGRPALATGLLARARLAIVAQHEHATADPGQHHDARGDQRQRQAACHRRCSRP